MFTTALLVVLAVAVGARVGRSLRRLDRRLAEGERREQLMAAYFAAVRMDRAGVDGETAQQAICRLANVDPSTADRVREVVAED